MVYTTLWDYKYRAMHKTKRMYLVAKCKRTGIELDQMLYQYIFFLNMPNLFYSNGFEMFTFQ